MATQSDSHPRDSPVGPLLRWVAPLGILALGCVWLLLATHQPSPTLNPRDGLTILSPPLPLPTFSLRSSEQDPLTRESLEGRWTFLSLGFTSCPDICPNTLGTLARIVERADPSDDSLRVLFVSVDPERDSPADLESYAGHFGPFVVGATGSHERLLELTRPLGLFYQRSATALDENTYGVEHSTTVLLVGPEAEIVALLRVAELEDDEILAALSELRGRA